MARRRRVPAAALSLTAAAFVGVVPAPAWSLARQALTGSTLHSEKLLKKAGVQATSVITRESALDELALVSAIVPDQFAFEEFEEVAPKFTLASSRTILEALKTGICPSLSQLVEEAAANPRCHVDPDDLDDPQSPAERETCLEESLFVLAGAYLLGRLPERALVSTELPLRVLADPAAAVRSGKRILADYADMGVDAGSVLLRVPASFEGLRATAAMSEAGLPVHVTNVFSLEQAALAKDAGAAAVQVYLGRVEEAGGDGVGLTRDVFRLMKGRWRKRPGPPPLVIAASVRSLSQAIDVSGVDYALMSPTLLGELRQMEGLPDDDTVFGRRATVKQIYGKGRQDVPQAAAVILPGTPQEFEAALPPLAKQLLAAGIRKNLKEHVSFRERLAKA